MQNRIEIRQHNIENTTPQENTPLPFDPIRRLSQVFSSDIYKATAIAHDICKLLTDTENIRYLSGNEQQRLKMMGEHIGDTFDKMLDSYSMGSNPYKTAFDEPHQIV